jgi:hypothetical protein
MEIYGKWQNTPCILNLALSGGEWSVSLPGRFNHREEATGTHWRGNRVGSTTGLEAMQKRPISCPCRESNYNSSVVHIIKAFLEAAGFKCIYSHQDSLRLKVFMNHCLHTNYRTLTRHDIWRNKRTDTQDRHTQFISLCTWLNWLDEQSELRILVKYVFQQHGKDIMF